MFCWVSDYIPTVLLNVVNPKCGANSSSLVFCGCSKDLYTLSLFLISFYWVCLRFTLCLLYNIFVSVLLTLTVAIIWVSVSLSEMLLYQMWGCQSASHWSTLFLSTVVPNIFLHCHCSKCHSNECCYTQCCAAYDCCKYLFHSVLFSEMLLCKMCGCQSVSDCSTLFLSKVVLNIFLHCHYSKCHSNECCYTQCCAA